MSNHYPFVEPGATSNYMATPNGCHVEPLDASDPNASSIMAVSTYSVNLSGLESRRAQLSVASLGGARGAILDDVELDLPSFEVDMMFPSQNVMKGKTQKGDQEYMRNSIPIGTICKVTVTDLIPYTYIEPFVIAVCEGFEFIGKYSQTLFIRYFFKMLEPWVFRHLNTSYPAEGVGVADRPMSFEVTISKEAGIEKRVIERKSGRMLRVRVPEAEGVPVRRREFLKVRGPSNPI